MTFPPDPYRVTEHPSISSPVPTLPEALRLALCAVREAQVLAHREEIAYYGLSETRRRTGRFPEGLTRARAQCRAAFEHLHSFRDVAFTPTTPEEHDLLAYLQTGTLRFDSSAAEQERFFAGTAAHKRLFPIPWLRVASETGRANSKTRQAQQLKRLEQLLASGGYNPE